MATPVPFLLLPAPLLPAPSSVFGEVVGAEPAVNGAPGDPSEIEIDALRLRLFEPVGHPILPFEFLHAVAVEARLGDEGIAGGGVRFIEEPWVEVVDVLALGLHVLQSRGEGPLGDGDRIAVALPQLALHLALEEAHVNGVGEVEVGPLETGADRLVEVSLRHLLPSQSLHLGGDGCQSFLAPRHVLQPLSQGDHLAAPEAEGVRVL